MDLRCNSAPPTHSTRACHFLHRQLYKAFPEEDSALLDSALAALASLAAGDRAHQDRIGALGVCELVVRAVERHAHSPHFVTRCCSVVVALSELERADEEGNHLYMWRWGKRAI